MIYFKLRSRPNPDQMGRTAVTSLLRQTHLVATKNKKQVSPHERRAFLLEIDVHLDKGNYHKASELYLKLADDCYVGEAWSHLLEICKKCLDNPDIDQQLSPKQRAYIYFYCGVCKRQLKEVEGGAYMEALSYFKDYNKLCIKNRFNVYFINLVWS